MKKYTANYTRTNPNFVIQNLVTNQQNEDLIQLLYVLKNVLQRGFPTTLSKYLQSELGKIHKLENFKEPFLFVSDKTPIWYNTIKGDEINNYYPARDFFEEIIPNEFGKYAFVQSLIIPEIEINEITDEENENFINQQVDFYLPQAKLVIEIDGQQHKLDDVQRVSDNIRDEYLSKKGIKTIRITTKELQNGVYANKIEQILQHLERYDKLLDFYKSAFEKIKSNKISEEEIKTKLLPTAIMRFQILCIELLIHNYLNFEEDWNFNILIHEDLPQFAELAIEDLFIWVDNLYRLKHKKELKKPNFNVTITTKRDNFHPNTKAINVDFSLLKKYTDENKINEDIIFVRTDYFDILKDKNYFRVSTAEPINYHIVKEDEPILEFFLNNIFDKPNFREGQFHIISNTLNRNDTIGLLPTGGGKSLCYQLPCLLQPSINFVVCPIKSLMYDQNDNLEKTLITNVNFITSDLEKDDRRKIEYNFEQGKYLFVWISPEKFQIPSFRDKISAIINNFSIAYAVIDEVHCLSEWGHTFRLSYLNLAKTIDKLSPKDENDEGKIKFIGLTATASVNVLKDIKIEFSRQKQYLEDENIKTLLDYSRKELQFEVIDDKGNKENELIQLLINLKQTEDFTENKNKAGLIFTPVVNGGKGCYPLANKLNKYFENKVAYFSGSVPNTYVNGIKLPIMKEKEFDTYKQQVQSDFKEDKYQILVATKAFGMGIDKQNIHYTFHYGLPSSVEALYQEAGRAGRWDKRLEENKNKIGKCYVLHSHEICNENLFERLFEKNTTFEEIKDIQEDVQENSRSYDVFTQFYLFLQGQNDVKEDLEIILNVINTYFEENTIKKIFWNDAYSKLEVNKSVLEKAIYRLSLLGVIADWTTDFVTHFEVEFVSLDEKHIIKSVSNYIAKYEPDTDVKQEIEKYNGNYLEKSISYLLNWIFENIVYNRKQALKTLSDWCTEFKDSESFKRRIDSYFKITETTFVLQYITENPKDIEKWFEALYLIEPTEKYDEKGNKIVIKTHIPEIKNTSFKIEQYEKLRDGVSRFLESYKDNIGLDFLSGFVRLALDNYDDIDGRRRFESSLYKIKENFSQSDQNKFLTYVIENLGNHLSENQKAELSLSISKYYPEKLEYLSEYYDLPYLLIEKYSEKIMDLKKLNHKLYEQIRKI